MSTAPTPMTEQDKALRVHLLFRAGTAMIAPIWEGMNKTSLLSKLSNQSGPQQNMFSNPSYFALQQRKLGGLFSDTHLANLLDEHAILQQEDDGSEEWSTSYKKMMVSLLKQIDAAGPAYFANLQQGTTNISAQNTKAVITSGIGKAMEQSKKILERLDKDEQHILKTLHTAPDKAKISVIKALKGDKVVWGFKLQQFSKKLSDPRHQALVGLLSDAIAKEKLDVLFNDEDCQKIAGLSYLHWVVPNEKNKHDLRHNAALQLGEILDNEERREATIALLKSFTYKAIPEALTFETKQELLSQYDTLLQEGYPTVEHEDITQTGVMLAMAAGCREGAEMGIPERVKDFIQNSDEFFKDEATIIQAMRRVEQGSFNPTFISSHITPEEQATLKQKPYHVLLALNDFYAQNAAYQQEAQNEAAAPKPKF